MTEPSQSIEERATAFREAWSARFAGGMLPFDNAYVAAEREGKTIAQAQQAGADALLAAYTEQLVRALTEER